MKIPSRTIAACAFLIALSVLLRRILTVPLPVGVLNFGGFPVILAGLLMGPWAGCLTGALSDVIGAVLFPRGPYVPFFTLTSMLTGAIPPVVVTLAGRKDGAGLPVIIFAVAVAQIVTKVVLFPVIMRLCFGYPLELSLAKALIAESIHVPVYSVLALSILKIRRDSYIRAS